MLRRWFERFLRIEAIEKGRFVGLWRRICKPSAADWTIWLAKFGGLYSIGADCSILPETIFTDPAYTMIGNNVSIAGAWISGHDGSVNMLNRLHGTKLDAVGPVIIKDNVFIGRGATILPGVSIGPCAIVGAGAVVSRDVPPNSVVAGNPARFIRTLDEHLTLVRERSEKYPWKGIIERREGGYDPALEPDLIRMRTAHFFGDRRWEE
ncbi:acyltransferase [Paracoccus aurantius]|uniref:acyltransferase n=1 Tax=Paracoccus aurantius TaxID=3073814 RepID=UPI0038FCA889